MNTTPDPESSPSSDSLSNGRRTVATLSADELARLRARVLEACGPLPDGAPPPKLSRSALAQYQRCPRKLNPVSDAARDMILGTLLGDGSVSLKTMFPRYVTCHCTKQGDYCQSKMDLLLDYTSGDKVIIVENRGYGKEVARFCTLCSPSLQFVRSLCFHETTAGPRKVVSQAWVDQMNWRQVAWWYQDDGCKQGRRMHFATHALSREEVDRLSGWLNRNGVACRTNRERKQDRHYWTIRCSTAGAMVLAERIREFMHPSLLYKLPDFLEKEGVCLECGQATTKDTAMGPVAGYCSDACRRKKERRRSNERNAALTPEQRAENYRRSMERRKADPEKLAKWKAYHAGQRARVRADEALKAAGNDRKRNWRRKRKEKGIVEKVNQTHICRYCGQVFANTATHRMGSRSQFVSCPAEACMARRKEDHDDLRRQRAREKWARERSAGAS